MQSTIHRSERICIDISDNVVSIIKLDPQGVMIRAGSAKAPTMPPVPDDAYVTDLSDAIKKAAWAAKVSMGFGASCVIVSGTPEAVIQRFTWPDMPTDALLSIVQEEMIPYLPGNPSHYTISCEVLKMAVGDGSGPATLEVLAAAMPIEHIAAITTACKWANFKPKRVDLREGARGRLAHYWCAPVEGEVPSTFAILDVGPGPANIAFYHNGLFHSNRYFTPELVKLNEVDDFELLMTVKAGGVDDNENAMRYDPRRLTEEIVSAINHFHRSVPGANLSCVLLMDDENIPGIEESLRAYLNMPMLKPSQWVEPGLKRPNLRRIDPFPFLDAFAAGMPPLSSHGCRMDLRMSNAAAPQGHIGFKVAAASMSRPTAQPEPFDAPEFAQPLPGGTVFPEPPIQAASSAPLPFDFDDPYADMQPEPKPQPQPFDDLFSDKAPDPMPFDFYDPYADTAPTGAQPIFTAQPTQTEHHEFPFDPIRAQADDHSGFPYAIPDDPHPPRSRTPIFIAAAIAVFVLIIAVLIPLRETMSLRSQLRYLENSIAAHTPPEAIIILEQERVGLDRQINAIRRDISHINDRKGQIRDFYLLPPALVVLPEVLVNSGLHVDQVVSSNHQVIVRGRTRDIVALARGTRYLREQTVYHHLFAVSFDLDPTDDNSGVDAYGYANYTITVTLHSGTVPFWLNGHIERRWP